MPFYPDQPEGPGFFPVGHPDGMRMEPNALEPPKPPRTPSPLEMPDSDIKPPEDPSFLDRLGAGFRQENMVVGAARALARDHDYGPPDPSHNPLDFIQGTDSEQYWDRFLGSRNERETNAIMGRIDQEIADRKLLADGSWGGLGAAAIGSIVDLPTLLPGGVVYKAARTSRALSAAKSAASVGAAAGAATAVQEGFLHWQQYTRTLEESELAVGGSIVLGAILGAGISGVSSTALSRMARTLEHDLKVPATTVDDLFGEGGLREMERAARAPDAHGVGAAAAGKPAVELKGALGAEKVFSRQDPVLRTLTSPFNSARETGVELFETVLGLTRNKEGITTAPIGGAVETRIKMQQAELGQAIRDLNDQFSTYRFGKTGVAAKAIRSEISNVLGQGGGKLTYKQFKEEVGKAMSAGDEHPIPEVAATAKRFRKLIDKHADEAIKYKLLDEEVVNAGRPSGKSSAKPQAQQAAEPPKTPDEALAEIEARINEQAGLSPEQLDLRVRAGEMLDQLEKTLGQQGLIPQGLREQIVKGLASDEPLYKELRDLLQRMADGAGVPGPDDLMAAIRGIEPGVEEVTGADRFGQRPQHAASKSWEETYPDFYKAHLDEQALAKQWNPLVEAILFPNGYRHPTLERWQVERRVMEEHPDLAQRYLEARQWYDLLERKMRAYKGTADPKSDYQRYWNEVLDTQPREDNHAWFNAFTLGEPPASRETRMRAMGNDILDQIERQKIRTLREQQIVKGPASVEKSSPDDLMAAIRAFHAPRETDALGFYSQALEAARRIPQAKGTPEQMVAMLKNAGVKDAEIQATGLDQLLGKSGASISRDDIIKHLEDNRVGVRESIYQGDKDTHELLMDDDLRSMGIDPNQQPAKWQSYSLDPSNPTYRETVLNLPPNGGHVERTGNGYTVLFDNGRSPIENGHPVIWSTEKEAADWLAAEGRPELNFIAGHFPQRNVIAHARTSLVRDGEGKAVFNVDELQSDWGQTLRDGGVRDAAKIAELEKQTAEAHAKAKSFTDYIRERDAIWGNQNNYKRTPGRAQQLQKELDAKYPDAVKASRDAQLREAELNTAKTAPPGHPLVNTTDQWTTTALRRLIRQAVESDADKISIPSGDTVLGYGMGGKKEGQRAFYDAIVPKNLKNILQKMDKTVEPQKIDTLKSHDGRDVGKGFTVFPLTEKVKASVREGSPMFSLRSSQQSGPPPAGSLAETHMRGAIEREIQSMLPEDVVARVTGQDFQLPDGTIANGLYDHTDGLVKVSLSGGPEKALGIGRHEVIHALRRSNLFSPDEWSALITHAKKTGVEGDMTIVHPDTGEAVSTLPIYRQMYTNMFRRQGLKGADFDRALDDFMNQELVAKMAESWEKGASYGRFIDGLFERARLMMEAVARGLQKLGITTWDDWLERSQAGRAQKDVLSGEVGSRGLKSGSVDPATGLQYAMSHETRAKLDELLGPEMVDKMFKDPSNVHPDLVRAAEILAMMEKRAAAEVEKTRTAPGGPDAPFSPKIADEVWDDKGQSYLTRMYNRQKISSQRGAFTRIIADYFEGAQQRAAAVFSRLKNEIERGAATDGEAAKDMEDLARFTGLSRQDLEASADKVVNHILGFPEGRLMYDLPAAVRGPLKSRTLRIPDKLIENYLERDIEAISRYYTRTMVPDIEMVRRFGSLDMADQIAKITDEATALSKAAPDEKTSKAFNDKAAEAVRDLKAVADRLRGTYALPEDPMAWLPRAARMVRTFNYLRLLGGMTLASMSDPMRTFMTQGLVSTLRDGWVPLIRSLQTVKLAGEEVKLAGTALDMVLDTRAMAIADIMDDYGRYSKFERGLHTAQEQFGVITLMAPWNAAWKQFTGMIVMTNIIRAAKRIQAGKATAKDIERLAASSIDEPHARLIADLFDRHGTVEKGVYLPNTQAWDISDPNIRNALEAFRSAMVRDVDRTIVTPGQDKPLWMSTEIGKIVGQVKSFSVASIQRTLIAGLQERDAGVLAGTVMMVGMGAVSEALKNIANREKQPEGAVQWAQQAIDRAGVLGYLMDVNHFAERATAGQIGLAKLTGKEVTRYAGRNWADAVLGPTAGLVKDAFDVSNAVSRRVFKGEQMAESDVRAMRRMLPMQNLFYLSWLFKELEKGTVSALGARPARPR